MRAAFATAPAWARAPMAASVDLVPCVDVFAALVIYLMGSFAAQAGPGAPLSDVLLPAARLHAASVDAARLTVTPVGIRLADQLVMGLPGGQVAAADLDAEHRLVPLYRALMRERLRRVTAEASEADAAAMPERGHALYLEAARGLPYGVVDGVLATAAAAGFDAFRLAVQEGE